jgi:hypothetical protein
MMKSYRIIATCLTLAAIGLLSSCRHPVPTTKPRPAFSASAPVAVKFGGVWSTSEPYIVHRASGAITMDGKDHPMEWRNAMAIKNFTIPVTKEPAKERTVVKMLWDDENLYIWFMADDEDLRATLKGKTAALWSEDVVEVFLTADYAKGSYYELELAPSNELLALQIAKAHGETIGQRANWTHHITTSMELSGTLNNPADKDKFYRGIIKVPFKDLLYAGNKAPAMGDQWRFISARCNLSKPFGRRQEFSAAVPLSAIDFHINPEYGTMKFSR